MKTRAWCLILVAGLAASCRGSSSGNDRPSQFRDAWKNADVRLTVDDL